MARIAIFIFAKWHRNKEKNMEHLANESDGMDEDTLVDQGTLVNNWCPNWTLPEGSLAQNEGFPVIIGIHSYFIIVVTFSRFFDSILKPMGRMRNLESQQSTNYTAGKLNIRLTCPATRSFIFFVLFDVCFSAMSNFHLSKEHIQGGILAEMCLLLSH